MIWTQELSNRLLELDTAGITQTNMARVLAVEFPGVFDQEPTRYAVKNALATARARARYLNDSPKAIRTPYLDFFEDYIKGVIQVEKDAARLEAILAKPSRKILVLSDIHVPFCDEVKLQKAIDMNRSADMVVISGDLMDGYNVSRWRKQKNVDHEIELDETVRLLQYLSETFPWVRIVRGNHDERALKVIQNTLPAELLYLFENEPIDLLVRPFANIEYVDNWWTKIGDAIIAHGEKSSSYEGRAAVLVGEFFLAKGWGNRLGLGDIRLIVEGHTHQISSTYRENLKMIEPGCLAQVMEYAVAPSADMRPPQNGCAIIVQNNGRTDFNASREILL